MIDTYTIKVTQRDIDLGIRGQSGHCIVATAIGRQIPKATFISVDAEDIRFSLEGRRLVYATPPSVGGYIIAFDAGNFDAIKPMTLRLASPTISMRKPRGARRLIVRNQQEHQPSRTWVPSRTRSFGQRVFAVNQSRA